MISNEQKKYILTISKGIELEEDGSLIKAARNHLIRSQIAGESPKSNFKDFGFRKEIQSDQLKEFAIKFNVLDIHPNHSFPYLSQGGEAQIYFDYPIVFKVNQGVFYKHWLDYFDSILIHNCLFPATYYKLLGFLLDENKMTSALLSQPYIYSDRNTNLNLVKEELELVGFVNERRNDYFNVELNLILEDMHDENVLIREGFLFFIDTVFYFRR